MTNAREMLMSNTGHPMDVQIRVTDGCPKSDILWTSIFCTFYVRTFMDIKWTSIGYPIFGHPSVTRIWTSIGCPVYVHVRADVKWT